MRYYVNFGTGAGDEQVDGTLEDAKKAAENGLAYTQTDVRIQTEDGEDVAVLKWYGVEPGEESALIVARWSKINLISVQTILTEDTTGIMINI